MRIGYDAKRAFLNNTGLGNYSRWLIKLMASYYPDNIYRLYTPKIRPGKWPDLLLSSNNTNAVTASGIFKSWWRTKGVVENIKADGIDIYHGLSHELPLGIRSSGVKSVVTIHDLIFLRYPQYFGTIDKVIYAWKVKHACKAADKIVAISQKTKQDIVELLGIPEQKISVVYQGCDETFKREYTIETKGRVKSNFQLPDKFILSVGTIEERKNLLLLINALPQVNDDVKLAVVGRKTKYFTEIAKRINDLALTQRVMFLQDVSFDDLPVIYQLASVFVYPSRYEGFGIPVLEAISSGVPVVAATGSCLEEAGGPHSLYVSPDDAGELAEAINSVLTNPALKATMIAEGLKFALNFADDKLAAQHMQLYQQLANA